MGVNFLPGANRFQYPGSPPMIDQSHPMARNPRLAAVARANGLWDMVGNRMGVNSGGSSVLLFQQTALGPSLRPVNVSSPASGLYIPFSPPFPGETPNKWTVAVIFEGPPTVTTGEGMIGNNDTGFGQKIQNGGPSPGVINFASGGSNITTIPIQIGHLYFTCASMHGGSPVPNCRHITLDMTTGQIQYATGTQGSGTFPPGTNYHMISYNVGGGANPGRISAGAMSATELSEAQLYAWANDPWGYWFQRPQRRTLALTGRAQLAANSLSFAMQDAATQASFNMGTSFHFPSSPILGQTTSAPNGHIYEWDGTKWTSDGGVYVPLAGGAMTGALTLNADPTLPLGAATKHYADNN
jgi:hypothetical protein